MLNRNSSVQRQIYKVKFLASRITKDKIIRMEANQYNGMKIFHWKEIIPCGPHAGPLLISPTIQGTFHWKEIISIEEYHSNKRISFHRKEIIPMEENHSIGRKSFHWKEIIPLEGNHSNPSGPHAGPLLISPTIQGTFSKQLKGSK